MFNVFNVTGCLHFDACFEHQGPLQCFVGLLEVQAYCSLLPPTWFAQSLVADCEVIYMECWDWHPGSIIRSLRRGKMPGKQSTKSYVISLIDTCTHRTWICARGEQKENDCSQEYLIAVQGDDLSSDAEAKGLLVRIFLDFLCPLKQHSVSTSRWRIKVAKTCDCTGPNKISMDNQLQIGKAEQ